MVMSYRAFSAPKKCSELTAATTLAVDFVSCLDGNESDYGESGTTLVGALDKDRSTFFGLFVISSLVNLPMIHITRMLIAKDYFYSAKMCKDENGEMAKCSMKGKEGKNGKTGKTCFDRFGDEIECEY